MGAGASPPVLLLNMTPNSHSLEKAMAVPLSEGAALALLSKPDVTSEELALLARSPVAAKSRKVMLAVVEHPRTPRHISLPLLRRMFTFDLMQVALTPAVAADIKRAAEEQILMRLESVSVGEKISLARRASGRIAAALLQDSDLRVISPALDNPQLTEALVVQALMRPHVPEQLFTLMSEHAKWCHRREVQIALLRSEHTPMERTTEIAKHFSEEFLREIVPASRHAALHL